MSQQLSKREVLYSDFIKEAAIVHAHSLSHELEEIAPLIALHAYASRIRLFSSEPVVAAADEFIRLIVQNYGETNMSVDEMRAAVLSGHIDPLGEFSSELN